MKLDDINIEALKLINNISKSLENMQKAFSGSSNTDVQKFEYFIKILELYALQRINNLEKLNNIFSQDDRIKNINFFNIFLNHMDKIKEIISIEKVFK